MIMDSTTGDVIETRYQAVANTAVVERDSVDAFSDVHGIGEMTVRCVAAECEAAQRVVCACFHVSPTP